MYCEREFDREELTDLCDLCYENVLFCEECGEYVMDDEYDEDLELCQWCKEKAISETEKAL
jgi:formylmethanofuran dehydrogenase subunit E